jgi:hypothetical protein
MRRGDGINPRLQRLERFDERLGIGPNAGKFLQRGKDVERGGIAVGIAAFGEQLGFGAPVTAGEIRNKLEQDVGRRRKRHAVGERVAQSTIRDGKVRRRVERGQHSIDQAGIVKGKDPEGIADDIIKIGADKIDVDVPGLLFRTRFVETPARQKSGDGRIVARAPGGWRCRRRGRLQRRGGGRRNRRAIELGVELLEHAGRLFAARHAKVQPLLGFGDQRGRVVFAIVAALAAILLRHRRHHSPRQRPAVRKLHAFGERHGGIVPRGAIIRAVVYLPGRRGNHRAVDQSGQKRAGVRARERRDAIL